MDQHTKLIVIDKAFDESSAHTLCFEEDYQLEHCQYNGCIETVYAQSHLSIKWLGMSITNNETEIVRAGEELVQVAWSVVALVDTGLPLSLPKIFPEAAGLSQSCFP